jgi:mannose-6-phosphate isomerase-like protein (cupin superfamily)
VEILSVERGMADQAWQIFDLGKLEGTFKDKPVEYLEFLNVPTLTCGLYHLARGSRDMQSPHDDDEMYYVLRGRARLSIGDETREVSAGSLLYVRATEDHSFFEIEEDMTLLVFFATPGG